jgi:hypothetical protein
MEKRGGSANPAVGRCEGELVNCAPFRLRDATPRVGKVPQLGKKKWQILTLPSAHLVIADKACCFIAVDLAERRCEDFCHASRSRGRQLAERE